MRGWVARGLLFAIRAYQAFVSPLLAGGCRFYPSCSHYAAQAIELHGPRRGAWLALSRLLRCRPFSPGGYDPVPENWPASTAGVPRSRFTSPPIGTPGFRNPDPQYPRQEPAR